MNYYSILILLLLLSHPTSAQLEFENIDNKKDTTFYPYDSTSNYPTLKNMKAFKGETFFVARVEDSYFHITLRTRLPEKNSLSEKRPKNKKNNNQKETSSFYFPPDEYSQSSNKDSLLGCYFHVQDVVKQGWKYYFKLLDQKRNTVVYFHFNPTSNTPYPFLTLGFYEKEKSKIGKTFSLHSSTSLENILTKERVSIYDPVTLDRIVIDKKTYSFYYIVKDKKGIEYKIIGSEFESVSR
jgi:hypothetical protein